MSRIRGCERGRIASRSIKLATAIALAIGAISASQAQADSGTLDEALKNWSQTVPAGIRTEIEPAVPILPQKSLDIVVFPLPIVSTLGAGGALVGALLYTIDDSKNTSFTGVGGFGFSSASWGAAFVQQAYFDSDRFRIDLAGGFASVNYDFYGVGTDSGSTGNSIPIRQSGYLLMAKAYARLAPSIYVGARYRGLTSNIGIRGDDAPDPARAGLLKNQLKISVGGFGPAAYYDSRDNGFYPRSGEYIDFTSYFATTALGFGGSVKLDYSRFDLAANKYWSLADDLVLAGRASFCVVTGNAPFFDLCSFGSDNDLRGYTAGRYRDKRMFATQMEARWQFYGRFAAVAFAGVGGVAPSISQFRLDALLPAVGVGVRYQASKDYGLNVSLDVAAGRNGTAVYIRVGEAF